MRQDTVTTNVYEFKELSDKAKAQALESHYHDNVSHDWWEYTYEDAGSVGLKITGFELDRGQSIDIAFCDTENGTADLILKNHGKDCGTHKVAKSFIEAYKELVATHSDGIDTDMVCEGKEGEFDDLCDELESELLKDLGNEYLAILQREYEYLTSDQVIIESIESNEYEFTEDGAQY